MLHNIVGILICRHCIIITNFDTWPTILITSGPHSFQSLIVMIYASSVNKTLDINDNKCFKFFLLPSWRLQFNNATTCIATLILFTDKVKFTWIVLWTEDQKRMQTCWIRDGPLFFYRGGGGVPILVRQYTFFFSQSSSFKQFFLSFYLCEQFV